MATMVTDRRTMMAAVEAAYAKAAADREAAGQDYDRALAILRVNPANVAAQAWEALASKRFHLADDECSRLAHLPY